MNNIHSPTFLDTGMPGQDSNPDIISRIAAGDEDALRTLYACYGQRLFSYALRLMGDESLAEEVVQDSLVAVWQQAGRYRGEGRVIAWLLGIVHHKALNLRRYLRRRPEEPVPDDLPTREASPEDQALASVQRAELRQGLDQLSEEHRLVLDLVFYQGLSQSEAAAVLGCPLGTVKSRLNYARLHLRSALARGGVNAEDLE